jgi:hypothetical protein
MKKLIALFAVLLIAAPAMAADWSFYGSARMATFWDHRDYGDTPPATLGDEDEDDDLLWDLQGNTRLGARVKADKVSGRIELALPSSNTHDGNVVTRLAYGTWKFADNMSLKVGKDYTPVSQFVSTQTFFEDLGLLGIGTTYGRRPGQIALQIGGFELALIQPNSTNTFAGGDTDEWLPKIEAKFGMPLGMFSFNVMGGFQTFTVEDVGGAITDDIDIVSYIVGADVGVNIGAFYVKAAGSFGQNWTNARWNDLAFTSNANAGAALDGTDDTDDCTSWMVSMMVGLKFSSDLAFEVGAGYRSDDNDAADNEDEVWSIYGNATITLAPGVYLVPEIGYVDYMDDNADNDQGYEWYAGMKWQIDF